MPTSPSRREFLGLVGLATSSLALGNIRALATPETQPTTQPTTDRTPLGDKIAIGLIGCGVRGRADLQIALQNEGVRCAAVCDVDTRNIKNAQADVERVQGLTPEGYRDYRQLLARKDLNAVIVATPTHWLSLITAAACLAKLDVYCEAPLSHNAAEGRVIADLAKKTASIVQVGTTLRSAPHVQQAIKVIQSGDLGKIGSTRSIAWDNDSVTNPIGTPADSEPPAAIDYDFWLGPAPKKPYNVKRCHTYWRYFFDYGIGRSGDYDVHMLDILLQAMNQAGPRVISAVGGTHVVKDIRDTYDTFDATYLFAGFQHATSYRCIASPMDSPRKGLYFYGTKGTLFVNDNGFEVTPRTETITVDGNETKKPLIEASKSVAPQLQEGQADPNLARHIANFFECLRTRKRPNGSVESVHRSATACHLANIALKTQRTLQWNPTTEQLVNLNTSDKPQKTAASLLAGQYREPWKLPQ